MPAAYFQRRLRRLCRRRETKAEENTSAETAETGASDKTEGTEAETAAAETEPLVLNPDGSKVIISLGENSITYGMLRMGIEQQKLCPCSFFY